MNEPDRAHLPIRRGAFQGVTNRTLEGSQPDWNLIGHPVPPEGAPNVLLVLIDDAGFGNPSTFGGPIQTPNYTRMADEGVRVQPLPRDGSCARPLARRCSPAATTMLSASARSGSSRAGSPGTRRYCRATARRCRGSSETTATARPRSASGTSRPTANRATRAHSTAGPTAGGSTTSTGSSAEAPASGTP